MLLQFSHPASQQTERVFFQLCEKRSHESKLSEITVAEAAFVHLSHTLIPVNVENRFRRTRSAPARKMLEKSRGYFKANDFFYRCRMLSVA